MVRITREENGTFKIRATAQDIETPWNPCPQVYWAEDDWLQNYSFGASKAGEVVWENLPDNHHRMWWQQNYALPIIRELCKNQDPEYMLHKLDILKRDLDDMINRFWSDREEFMTLTEKDKNVFGTFNAMSELHVEPLFDGVDHPEIRDALKECIKLAKGLGTVEKPEEVLPLLKRCRTKVNKVVRRR